MNLYIETILVMLLETPQICPLDNVHVSTYTCTQLCSVHFQPGLCFVREDKVSYQLVSTMCLVLPRALPVPITT